MFTGLIEHIGTVHGIAPTDAGVRIVIDPQGWQHRPDVGDSIAINGCCLTVAAFLPHTESNPDDASATGQGEHTQHGLWAFDAIPETLSKTTLGGFEPGRRVHLEHAARADTLLGGHIVQGHVDGLGTVAAVDRSDGWRVRISPPPALTPFMSPKGSVCIDGVSLTIADLDQHQHWLEVALIPVTLDKTTLGDLRPGQKVNLEADIITKTVVAHLEHALGPLVEAHVRDAISRLTAEGTP